MNVKLKIAAGILAILIVLSLAVTFTSTSTQTDVYIGIDVAYDVPNIEAVINQVSPYTNLFILGCTAITQNQTRLDSACQYLYEKKMNFIVYQDIPLGYIASNGQLFNQTQPQNSTNSPVSPTTRNFTVPNQPRNFTRPIFSSTISNWTQTAKERWGSQFLGFYFMDEVAGRQLDLAPGWVEVTNASDYVDAANQFNARVSGSIHWFHGGYSNWQGLSLFSSDYALYQYDYDVGYDTIFAQLGWNYSRQLNIALCRGAATAASKDWGAIIAWEYNQSPYIESADALYNDLVLAYNNGAKYITVFDSNRNYTASILTIEHYNALKDFWQYTKDHPRIVSSASQRVAYVLPAGYGYGFRGPTDSIWGLWPSDSFSTQLSTSISNALAQYGENLDIVYNQIELNKVGYQEYIYWDNNEKTTQ
jgi:hypothetical protein